MPTMLEKALNAPAKQKEKKPVSNEEIELSAQAD